MPRESAWASTSSTDVEDTLTMVKLRLQNLLLVTGYPMNKQRGLRRFGPAPHAEKVPLGGSEVFVHQLPRDALEDEIYCFFRAAGDIYEVRLMVNASGVANRGFCFVRFFNPQQANHAMAWLSVQDFRPNHKLLMGKSRETPRDNLSLILTGVPRQMTKGDLQNELSLKGIRCKDVIVLKPYKPCYNNRGYVFLEFNCNDDAVAVRQKHHKIYLLGDCLAKMEWSQPLHKVASDVMAKVTILFLRNLDPKLKRDMFIKTLRGILNYSTVSKVYKRHGYGFIHFHTREMAEIGLNKLQDYFIWTDVEVEWSKPPPIQRQNLNYQQASSGENSDSNCTKHQILHNFIKRLWDNRVETRAWCLEQQEADANINLCQWKPPVGYEDYEERWLDLRDQERADKPQEDKENYESPLKSKSCRGY